VSNASALAVSHWHPEPICVYDPHMRGNTCVQRPHRKQHGTRPGACAISALRPTPSTGSTTATTQPVTCPLSCTNSALRPPPQRHARTEADSR
jgi:hypothetical protein